MLSTIRLEKNMKIYHLEKDLKNYLSTYLLPFLKFPPSINYEITDKIISNYNINVIFKIDDEKYLLRINIQQQSGLQNQIEYEYKIHKYLNRFGITPKVFLIDTSKEWLPYDFMLEEFINGIHIDYDEPESIRAAAKILSKLHKAPLPKPNFLITWEDPLLNLLEELIKMYEDYRNRRIKNFRLIEYGGILLNKLQKITPKYKDLFKPNSIVHTDVVNDNFLISNEGIKIIDWEKPRIEDESYDLCVFLGKPSQCWGSPKLMTEEEKKLFVEIYCNYGSFNRETIIKKIEIREPFVSFRWILWAAHRKADVDENIIPEEIAEFHIKNYHRYEKTAALDNVVELIKKLNYINGGNS